VGAVKFAQSRRLLAAELTVAIDRSRLNLSKSGADIPNGVMDAEEPQS
jgi:hypothetical protein